MTTTIKYKNVEYLTNENCEQLSCSICLGVYEECVIPCTNGHGFCKACVQRLVTPKCPLCQFQLIPAQYWVHDLTMHNRITAVQVHCRSEGCNVQVPLRDVESHLCPLQLVTCGECEERYVRATGHVCAYGERSIVTIAALGVRIERLPNLYDTLLAFKIANYSKDPAGKDPMLNVYVMIWMTVRILPGMMAESHDGTLIRNVNDIRRKTKYCAPEVSVIGIQFLGKPDEVQRALWHYRSNRGYITSKFDGRFKYEVEQTVEEKEFAQPGRGGCVKGIHFYVDYLSATEFGGCADCARDFPVVTRKLGKRLGTIEAIPTDSDVVVHRVQNSSTTGWAKTRFKSVNWREMLVSTP